MRTFLTAVLLLVAASTCAAAATDLKIIRIWPSYRPTESFERISEFLGKDENPRDQLILRTQPDSRAGYYFLVRLKNPDTASIDVKIELQVISPFAPAAKTYHFTCALPAGSHAVNLGLTGADWPGKPSDEVVAWQLRLLSSSDVEIAKTQSYLWTLPDKK